MLKAKNKQAVGPRKKRSDGCDNFLALGLKLSALSISYYFLGLPVKCELW